MKLSDWGPYGGYRQGEFVQQGAPAEVMNNRPMSMWPFVADERQIITGKRISTAYRYYCAHAAGYRPAESEPMFLKSGSTM